MDEKIIKTTEDAVEEVVKTNCRSGQVNALSMLIGAGLTLALLAGGKKLKKAIDNRKAKKDAEDTSDTDNVISYEDLGDDEEKLNKKK